MNKNNSPEDWAKFARDSAALRRKFESIFASASESAADEDVEVIGCFRTLETESRAWKSSVKSVVDNMSALVDSLKPRRAKALDEYPDRLRRLLNEQGNEVFGEGSPLIVNGVVHVDLKLNSEEIAVNGRRLDSLAYERVASQVKEELDRITAEMTQANDLLSLLLNAYRISCAESGKEFGVQIELLELLPYVALGKQKTRFLRSPTAKAFSDYPVESFRADLYGLLKSQSLTINEFQFIYSSGSNTKGAIFMFVPPLGRAAHVGRAWFEVVKG